MLLGAGFTLEADSFDNPQVALALAGTTLGLGGATTIHNAHGNWVRGAGSFLLRGGTMSVGAIAGVALGSDCNEEESSTCAIPAVLGGLALGIVAARVVDTTLLAYDSEDQGPSLAPTMSASPNGAWLGVTGRF